MNYLTPLSSLRPRREDSVRPYLNSFAPKNLSDSHTPPRFHVDGWMDVWKEDSSKGLFARCKKITTRALSEPSNDTTYEEES